jgi:hypothetical protein
METAIIFGVIVLVAIRLWAVKTAKPSDGKAPITMGY